MRIRTWNGWELESPSVRLSTSNHDRDRAGLTYVYPVVSRRARGVSIGINLNPNNACNWRCVYCQVPGLVRGKAPVIDLQLLESELGGLVDLVRGPDWMERNVPAGSRRINDLAFSGNGEPTSSAQFAQAVDLAARVLAQRGLSDEVRLVLITNGSLVHQAPVAAGLQRLAEEDGEVWFKLDAADEEGQRRVNDSLTGHARQLENLATCARTCRTWVQTLALDFGGPSFDDVARERYCAQLAELVGTGVPLAGVHLYGLERASHQPEAPQLAPLAPGWLESFAEQIRAATGLEVRVSV
jgi:wyosine [tRNA(Phe)-imidazoG37] synthetase (radical SAM superfamily)